ncbi:MAG TPA: tyrosine-type recombinase/integrase [Alphaproteobacteria bacterium]|nr:tyrosine-type recombinase/integrase [Alphaproteobacteria bacterium]
MTTRTPVREKAKQFAKLLLKENPDYNYLRELFRHLRQELEITPGRKEQRLPYVPTQEEVIKFYKVVWESKNMNDVLVIKTLLYTGVRVSELVHIKLDDIDETGCQIRINQGKVKKDRIVPYPESFKVVLSYHIATMRKNGSVYLFESEPTRAYSDRGIRKMLSKYTKEAGIAHSISPHKLRHFLFTWLKKQGLDDALIQPFSGHKSRKSLEIYSSLSFADTQENYEKLIKNFPV